MYKTPQLSTQTKRFTFLVLSRRGQSSLLIILLLTRSSTPDFKVWVHSTPLGLRLAGWVNRLQCSPKELACTARLRLCCHLLSSSRSAEIGNACRASSYTACPRRSKPLYTLLCAFLEKLCTRDGLVEGELVSATRARARSVRVGMNGFGWGAGVVTFWLVRVGGFDQLELGVLVHGYNIVWGKPVVQALTCTS